MSLMTCASGESVYRGYEYYTEGKVSEIQTKAKGQFEGTVQGTNKNSYKVFMILLIRENLIATVLTQMAKELYVNIRLPCILVSFLPKQNHT